MALLLWRREAQKSYEKAKETRCPAALAHHGPSEDDNGDLYHGQIAVCWVEGVEERGGSWPNPAFSIAGNELNDSTCQTGIASHWGIFPPRSSRWWTFHLSKSWIYRCQLPYAADAPENHTKQKQWSVVACSQSGRMLHMTITDLVDVDTLAWQDSDMKNQGFLRLLLPALVGAPSRYSSDHEGAAKEKLLQVGLDLWESRWSIDITTKCKHGLGIELRCY